MTETVSSQTALDLEVRLRGGDMQALAMLIERNRSRLERTIRLRLDARLARRLTVEDIMQEAWLAASQRVAHYAADGFTHPYPWLRAILLQTMVDLHRHHLGAQMRDARCEVPIAGGAGGRKSPEATSEAMALELSGRMPSPSGEAMRRESTALITAALDQLGPADREVIALRHFEDLGNDEIAETLGIQAKAASIRYIRALKRLRDLLMAHGLSLGDLHAG